MSESKTFTRLFHADCMDVFKNIPDNQIQLTLTDIPYGAVNRDSNGLRNLNKKNADVITFELNDFLNEVYRVTSGTVIIFCAKEQLSHIHKFFANKKGTVRQIIWQKSNPSPMNGQHIYLSGVENAVWYKKRGGTFNAYCKNTVFKYPCGRSKLHPTEKNHGLLKELILDNSNEGDLILDPCMGSGSHILVAKQLNRNAIGIELDNVYFNIAKERINKASIS